MKVLCLELQGSCSHTPGYHCPEDMCGEVTCSGCRSVARNFLTMSPVMAMTRSPKRGVHRTSCLRGELQAVSPYQSLWPISLSPSWQVLSTAVTVHKCRGKEEWGRQGRIHGKGQACARQPCPGRPAPAALSFTAFSPAQLQCSLWPNHSAHHYLLMKLGKYLGARLAQKPTNDIQRRMG